MSLTGFNLRRRKAAEANKPSKQTPVTEEAEAPAPAPKKASKKKAK